MNNDKLHFRPLASLLFLALLLPKVQATLLFYEGFDYAKGEELGDTVATSRRWENDKNQFTVGAGSLDYNGFKSSTGNRLNVASTSPSMDSVRTAAGTWDAQSSGALYVSFLLRVESVDGIATTNSGTSLLTISKAANNTQLLGINLRNSDGIKLGVLKYPSGSVEVSSAFFSSGPGTNLSANGSTTYLVIAKYEWVEGADNDAVTVWINPQTLGGNEDPANKVSTSAGHDGAESAGRLTLSRGPDVTIDEIRIGRTWAEVTPASDPPQLSAEPKTGGR